MHPSRSARLMVENNSYCSARRTGLIERQRSSRTPVVRQRRPHERRILQLGRPMKLAQIGRVAITQLLTRATGLALVLVTAGYPAAAVYGQSVDASLSSDDALRI